MRRIDPDDLAFWWVIATFVAWIVIGVMIGIKYEGAVRCCAEARCADAVD